MAGKEFCIQVEDLSKNIADIIDQIKTDEEKKLCQLAWSPRIWGRDTLYCYEWCAMASYHNSDQSTMLFLWITGVFSILNLPLTFS